MGYISFPCEFFMIAINHRTKKQTSFLENQNITVDFVGIYESRSGLDLSCPYGFSSFEKACQFESRKSAELFFNNNKKFIMIQTNEVETYNPRIIRVNLFEDCVDLEN